MMIKFYDKLLSLRIQRLSNVDVRLLFNKKANSNFLFVQLKFLSFVSSSSSSSFLSSLLNKIFTTRTKTSLNQQKTNPLMDDTHNTNNNNNVSTKKVAIINANLNRGQVR